MTVNLPWADGQKRKDGHPASLRAFFYRGRRPTSSHRIQTPRPSRRPATHAASCCPARPSRNRFRWLNHIRWHNRLLKRQSLSRDSDSHESCTTRTRLFAADDRIPTNLRNVGDVLSPTG